VFLGTATLIRSGAIFLTADHVTRDWNDRLFVGAGHQNAQLLEVNVLDRDPRHDLALLRTVDEFSATPRVHLQDDCAPVLNNNLQLMAIEYSDSDIEGTTVNVNPATRLGNITRDFAQLDFLGAAGAGALELSFPALRGASGAAVFYNQPPFTVVGVVVANNSYHLLPAQIESVLDEKNELLEETRFMLPQG
jgi:hypothetical protein